MVFYKDTTDYGGTQETFSVFLSPPPEVTANEDVLLVTPMASTTTLSSELKAVKQGEYSKNVASKLSAVVGWSYSDFETFKDMVADHVGPGIDTIMIQVKNEPLLVEATAQMMRTDDKKVIIIAFRGTEMTNLANWLTDAVAKKCDFYTVQSDPVDHPDSYIQVHEGFKRNFDQVWSGQKGVLKHLMHPEMMRKDYDYSKDLDKQEGIRSEQDQLEAIYICGHSLGGAMASLAGLFLGAMSDKPLFSKLRGVYTYGAPMAVDDRDRARCQNLCGLVTFRHVYYNDLVPHLPPLSAGSFDHFGTEYRYHPRDGWKKRECGWLRFHSGRCTQVVSITATAYIGVLDGIFDNINWLSFFRGEDRSWPVIGVFSRGYLKMPWSVLDHSPVGYITTLKDDGSTCSSTGSVILTMLHGMDAKSDKKLDRILKEEQTLSRCIQALD